MNNFLEILKAFGPSRIAAMAAVTVALIGLFAFIFIRMSQPPMGLLFSGLSLEDSSAIVKDLEAKGIVYQLRGDGSTIMVPRDSITKVRMQLAEKRLPASGGVGYEIFDKGDSFSATSFIQNVNHLRALEGELARTIKSINRIDQARVHLALPERQLFAKDREQPSASIVLKMRGELESAQVRAIRHLVASAVEGLNPQRISIVDETGRLLADGAADGPAGMDGFEDRRNAQEHRMRKQVQDIVESIVGQGRTRVQVSTELDFNRLQQTQELFDPESRVVRSTQTREEKSAQTARDGSVSVGNELPGSTASQGENTGKDTSNKTEEIVNYEISRTTKTEVMESGRIKRLSVAVLVDGIYTRTPEGQVTYQPRPQEELDRISALVRSAIGFDQRRGDQIEVVNLRFAEAPPAPQEIKTPTLVEKITPSPADIVYLIEMAGLLLVALLVVLIVVRPLVRRMLEQNEILNKQSAGNMTNAAGGQAAAPQAIEQQAALPNSQTQEMINRAQATGEMHAQTIQHVGELVDRNPRETATILRQWLKEAA